MKKDLLKDIKKWFLDFTLLLAILFTTILLFEAILLTKYLLDNNPELMNKDKIKDVTQTFAMLFAIISLTFLLSGAVSNKTLKNELLDFGGKWVSIFFISAILTFSKSTFDLYLEKEGNYDILRSIFVVWHHPMISYMVCYIAAIAGSSFFLFIKITFSISGHYDNNKNLKNIITKHKIALLVTFAIFILLYLYVYFSLDKPPKIFFIN